MLNGSVDKSKPIHPMAKKRKQRCLHVPSKYNVRVEITEYFLEPFVLFANTNEIYFQNLLRVVLIFFFISAQISTQGYDKYIHSLSLQGSG